MTVSYLVGPPQIWIPGSYFKPVDVHEQTPINFKDEGKEKKSNLTLNLGAHFS